MKYRPFRCWHCKGVMEEVDGHEWHLECVKCGWRAYLRDDLTYEPDDVHNRFLYPDDPEEPATVPTNQDIRSEMLRDDLEDLESMLGWDV